MVCFVPSACLFIRKSCQRRDFPELGNIRNWTEHCTTEGIQKYRDLVVVVNFAKGFFYFISFRAYLGDL